MTIKNTSVQVLPSRPILSYLKDLPNICSLAGLCCTLIAIYFLILGIYNLAMIGMIWAVAFDWADGLIARKNERENWLRQSIWWTT
jgi:CDP-diacylglycerol--serine O-phosphatidyltransferase